MRWTAVALAFVAGSASAAAPSAFGPIDARLSACLTNDGSTPGVNACYDTAHTAADTILNRTYSAWVDALGHPSAVDAHDDAEILKRLIASERVWINFRDKDCDLQSTSMLGGTGESNVYAQCLYQMTKQRVLDLQTVEASR